MIAVAEVLAGDRAVGDGDARKLGEPFDVVVPEVVPVGENPPAATQLGRQVGDRALAVRADRVVPLADAPEQVGERAGRVRDELELLPRLGDVAAGDRSVAAERVP